MIRASVAEEDGRLYYDGHPDERKGDVFISRFWRPEEAPVRACGADCPAKVDHAVAGRCVVPHDKLIAARAQAAAEEAAIQSATRAMALEWLRAKSAEAIKSS